MKRAGGCAGVFFKKLFSEKTTYKFVKKPIISTLAGLAIAACPVSADLFPVFVDDFDDGSPTTNSFGGWDQIATSFPTTEENSVLTFGPDNGGYNSAEFHSSASFPFPTGTDSYILEWEVEPFEVITSGGESFSDIRFEIALPAVGDRKGAMTQELFISRGGTISFQTDYKQGDQVDGEGNVVTDDNGDPVPRQAAIGPALKDPQLDENGAGFRIGFFGYDQTVPHTFRVVLTATDITIFLDDVELSNTPLVSAENNYSFTAEEGNPYADGFYIMMRGQGRDGAEGFVGLDKISLTLDSDTSPIAWPAGATSVSEDFNDTLPLNWSVSGWTQIDLPVPVNEMLRNSTSDTGGATGPNIGDSNEFAPDGFWFDPDSGQVDEFPTGLDFETPLPAILPATVLSDLNAGFGGQWLQSLATSDRLGTTTVRFEQLPEHTGIDIDLVFAAFDSLDNDDFLGNPSVGGAASDTEGGGENFRIVVDGNAVYEGRFFGGGRAANLNDSIAVLGNNLNFSSQYREHWGPERTQETIDDGTFGREPTGVNDRHTIIWSRDSAYDLTGLFSEEGGTIIPHTSDTLEISFVHGLDSGYNPGFTDEGMAIDGVTISLINDPTANAAIPVVSVLSADGSSVELSWTEVGEGTLYTVERSTTLEVDSWTELATDLVTASYTDSSLPSGTKAFYRVIAQN